MNRNISVDTGKFDTKAVMAKSDGSTKRIIFRTKASVAYDENLWQKGKSHLVTYNDVTYKVGEDADDDSVSFDKSPSLISSQKNTLTNSLAGYAAIPPQEVIRKLYCNIARLNATFFGMLHLSLQELLNQLSLSYSPAG